MAAVRIAVGIVLAFLGGAAIVAGALMWFELRRRRP